METEIKYKRSTAWFSLNMTILGIGMLIFLASIWPLAILFAVVILVLVLQFVMETITLKKDCVLLRLGIISLHLHEIPYDKINSVSIRQGLFGRIFNYGNISIAVGNETSRMVFQAIEDPHKVKKQMKALKEMGEKKK